MSFRRFVGLLPMMVPMLLVSCADSLNQNVSSFYRELRESPHGGAVVGLHPGVLARLGKHSVLRDDAAYANTKRTVLPDQVGKLDVAARERVLRRILVRRAIVSKALKEDAFSSAEARAFLLARMEQAMEDFYIKSRADDGLGPRAVPGKGVLSAFLRQKGRSVALAGGLHQELSRRMMAQSERKLRVRLAKEVLRENRLELVGRAVPTGAGQ